MRNGRAATQAQPGEQAPPEYVPANAWPGMPPPAPPITLSEPDDDAVALPAPPVATGLDAGTVREMAALFLLLLGTAAVATAGFLIGVVVGLFVLGALLLGLGILLGISS